MEKGRNVEYLLPPVPIRQLEDQVGEITELLKWCKEEMGTIGQVSRS
jgi:hypothetical protein